MNYPDKQIIEVVENRYNVDAIERIESTQIYSNMIVARLSIDLDTEVSDISKLIEDIKTTQKISNDGVSTRFIGTVVIPKEVV